MDGISFIFSENYLNRNNFILAVQNMPFDDDLVMWKKNLQYAKWVFTVALVLSIFHEVPGSCDILGLSQSYSKICNSSDSVLKKYYNYIICLKKYHKSTTRSTK